jgi:hypothetical protein
MSSNEMELNISVEQDMPALATARDRSVNSMSAVYRRAFLAGEATGSNG